MEDSISILSKQKKFFRNGQTKNYKFRIDALKRLKSAILEHEKELVKALWQDLRKSEFESYETEIGFVLTEINYAVRCLKRWMKPTSCSTPLYLFPSRSRIITEPYGVVLVISPWNYPFQLLFAPLVGVIAAGNCAILKPSPLTPATTTVMNRIINSAFPDNYIALVDADNSETDKLLQQHFDYIFFTGGVNYGRHVMKAAAEHLTPVTLELGGKSPCIVDKDADIAIAAKRIVWGKFLNCGQTCVAPDYLLVHRDVKAVLMSKIKEEITKQYGTDPKRSPDYPRIINSQHFERLISLISGEDIIIGGDNDPEELYIAPTVLDNVKSSSKIMQEEIFGPLLPVMEYSKLEEAIEYINSKDKPLALYCFTNDKRISRKILAETSSGGACINDTTIHPVNSKIPFGGVGQSGMGMYHGYYSYKTFSHTRSVMISGTKLNINTKYAPYGKKLNLLKKVMK